MRNLPLLQPLTVPPGLLIFNDIRLRGFWLTGGYAKASALLAAAPTVAAAAAVAAVAAACCCH